MGWSCIVTNGAKDCICYCWLPPLKGWPEPSGGRAPCPVCGSKRAISIQAKHGRPVWNTHCLCPDELIGKAIASMVACYEWSPPRARRVAPDLDLTRALLLDREIPDSALRLGCLRALGMPEKEIRKELGLPKRTYYWAVQWLAQNRRSR